MKYCVLIVVAAGLLYGHHAKPAQTSEESSTQRQWYFSDPLADSVSGISLLKACDVIEGRPAREVVVAVIDTGFDIEHPHLRNNLWINRGEIPGNGIDDDDNGYVDDVHGWNFLGGPEGNVLIDNMEVTREYVRLLPRYGSRANSNGPEFEYWIEVKREFLEKRNSYEKKYNKYADLLNGFREHYEVIGPFLTEGALSISILNDLQLADEELVAARDALVKFLDFYEKYYAEKDIGVVVPYRAEDFERQINDMLDSLRLWTEYFYNTDYDPRHRIDDDADRPRKVHYGNNEVWEYDGPYGYHGTHVAGIIAGHSHADGVVRGVAEDVKLMLLRACSTGDERDKDIASALRYAADNGAQIINMSFGKFYSPRRKLVNRAIRYAGRKGLVMVHAAGNEYTNTDIRTVYPQPKRARRSSKYWISVGATDVSLNENLVAAFSNYGKETVDIFAPGVQIFSSMPGNSYKMANGTSMAAPVVSGVAALLLSHYPDLTAREVRDIIMESAFRPQSLEVLQPGSSIMINFNDLSSSGGIVNAYRAVQLAEQRTR